MQKLLTQACTSVINIANNYVEANKSNNIVESRDFVTKTADAITILTKLNTMLTNERKKKDQNQHFLRVTVTFVTRSSPSQYIFQGTIYQKSSEEPNTDTSWRLQFRKHKKTGLASTKKRLSTSSDSLNYQVGKKNYSSLQHQQSRQNPQNSLHRYQTRN